MTRRTVSRAVVYLAAALSVFGGLALSPGPALAQYTTPNTAASVGGACTTGTYAWPDSNAMPMKCVSSLWVEASPSNVTWPLLGPTDSASAPDYSWSGHANSGFYYNSGIGVAIGGANLANFTSTGFGVGTPTPQVKLDVTGSLANFTTGTEDEFHITRLVQGGVSWPQVAAFQLGTYNTTGACCGPQTRLDINLKAAANNTLTGDTNIMTLQSNGNIGIGTAAPGRSLTIYSGSGAVVGDATSGLLIQGDISGVANVTGINAANNANNDILFNAATANILYLKSSNGFVGIGTNAPLYALQVGGVTGANRVLASGGNGSGGGAEYMIAENGTINTEFGNYSAIFGGTYDADTTILTHGANLLIQPPGGGGGSVGIGTANPGASLTVGNNTFEVTTGGVVTDTGETVNGTMHATGAVQFDSTVSYGVNSTRTEVRTDAGASGTGIQSGFFNNDGSTVTDYPAGASSWWHLLDVRHQNPANNYAMQIAGSFFDQNLYFRKTNNSASTAWTRLLGSTDISGTQNYVAKFTGANTLGNSQIFDNSTGVGIGTATPIGNFSIWGGGAATGETIWSGATNAYAFVALGTTMTQSYWAVAASNGQFDTSAVPGDVVLRSAGGALRFNTNGGPGISALTLNGGNGNVGIGTNNPSTQFQVRAGSTESLGLFNYGGTMALGAFNDGFTAWENLTINPGGGNVGIGTITPNAKFDVENGNGDGIVLYQPVDNQLSIQTYIDTHWSDRLTYGGPCCNILNINSEVGYVNIGNAIAGGGITMNGTTTHNGNVNVASGYTLTATSGGCSADLIDTNGAGVYLSMDCNQLWSTGGPLYINYGGNNTVLNATAGNVGIGGAPNSLYMLDVQEPTATERLLSTTTGNRAYLKTDTGNNSAFFGVENSTGNTSAGGATANAALAGAAGPYPFQLISSGNVHVTMDALGNFGIGTATPRSALDTWTGTMSGAPNDYAKGELTFSGGGTVTWAGGGGNLKWTTRFIMLPMELATASSGYVDINEPTSGTIPAGQTYNNVARSWTSSGIVLAGWEALWAAHTVGGGPDGTLTWYITTYGTTTNTFNMPSNWILVAAVNGDDNSVKLGNGQIIPAGGTFNDTTNGPYVSLQASTPGTQQTGSSNVSGNGIFGTYLSVGGFTIPSGPSSNIFDNGDITIGGAGGAASIMFNLYYSGGWKYANTGYGSAWRTDNTGNMQLWQSTASGTAGATATVSPVVTIGTTNFGINTTNPGYTLEVHGNTSNFYSATTPTTAATAQQITIGEATDNSAYRLSLGYFLNGSSVYNGVIQSTNSSSGSSLLLNPNGGNVGIGTTAPQNTLQVQGSEAIANSGGLSFAGVQGSNNSNQGVWWYDIGSAAWGRISRNASTGVLQIDSQSGGYPIALNGTNTSAGNFVGVGLPAPHGPLDVSTNLNGAIGAANGVSDGVVIYQAADNSSSIQSYIDGQWAARTTYASGCCNTLNIDTEVGIVNIGNTVDGDVVNIDTTLVITGGLTFTGANPTISTGGSYIVIPKGLYISTSSVPLYTEAIIEARGGIADDTAAYLTINGGTSGYTDVTGRLGIANSSPAYALDAAGIINTTVGLRFAGGAANVGGDTWTQINNIYGLANNGTSAFAWNYSNGGGEVDLFINRDGGSTGGLNIYDFPNSNGTITNMMTIQTGGVGIGNASPGGALDILGTNYAQDLIVRSASARMDLYSWSDGTNYFYSANAANNASALLTFGGYGGYNGTFNFKGNVGLGTNVPEFALDVAGTSNILRVGTDANMMELNYNQLWSTGGALYLEYNTNYNTIMNANGGSVGIGTTTIPAKLTVNGTIYSETGGIEFPDGTTQTTAAGSSYSCTKILTTIGTFTPSAGTKIGYTLIGGGGGGAEGGTAGGNGTVTVGGWSASGGAVTVFVGGGGGAGGGGTAFGGGGGAGYFGGGGGAGASGYGYSGGGGGGSSAIVDNGTVIATAAGGAGGYPSSVTGCTAAGGGTTSGGAAGAGGSYCGALPGSAGSSHTGGAGGGSSVAGGGSAGTGGAGGTGGNATGATAGGAGGGGGYGGGGGDAGNFYGVDAGFSGYGVNGGAGGSNGSNGQTFSAGGGSGGTDGAGGQSSPTGAIYGIGQQGGNGGRALLTYQSSSACSL